MQRHLHPASALTLLSDLRVVVGDSRLSLISGAAALACFSVAVDEGGTSRYWVVLKRETEPNGSPVPQDIDSLTATTLPSIAAGRRLSKLMGT